MVDSVAQPAAAGPLRQAKFYLPSARPGSVARPRLFERLQRSTEGKLTLISAPAGFGKTSLMAEWLAAAPAEPRSVAWLSVDQRDNRPASFWTYVVAAPQTVEPELGRSAMALLQLPQLPPVEFLLTTLLNEVAGAKRDYVLVLDDYHLIDTRSIHDGIAFLLDHLPRSLHLVITGRSDPPLPLARLRARGELVEIRAAELRFTREEAAALLNETMGLHLSAQDVSALEARTEGWVAGLQLVALSLQGRADPAEFIETFAGDDGYIVDYLVEEVLERQPPELRPFLLETSILDRLSGGLCDAVTTGDVSGSTLAALERGNLLRRAAAPRCYVIARAGRCPIPAAHGTHQSQTGMQRRIPSPSDAGINAFLLGLYDEPAETQRSARRKSPRVQTLTCTSSPGDRRGGVPLDRLPDPGMTWFVGPGPGFEGGSPPHPPVRRLPAVSIRRYRRDE